MESMFLTAIANQYVTGILDQVKEKIREIGLNRWTVKKYEHTYGSPEHDLFNFRVLAQDLLFGGADNIDAKDVIYDSSTSSINFEICVPNLILKSGSSSVTMLLCAQEFGGAFHGWIGVKNIRAFCKARLTMDESSGIKLEDLDISFDVENINSNIHLTVLGKDFSEIINNYLRVKLPEIIKSQGNFLKEMLEGIIRNAPHIPNNVRNFIESID